MSDAETPAPEDPLPFFLPPQTFKTMCPDPHTWFKNKIKLKNPKDPFIGCLRLLVLSVRWDTSCHSLPQPANPSGLFDAVFLFAFLISVLLLSILHMNTSQRFVCLSNSISGIRGWSQIHNVAINDFESPLPPPPLPEGWDPGNVLPRPAGRIAPPILMSPRLSVNLEEVQGSDTVGWETLPEIWVCKMLDHVSNAGPWNPPSVGKLCKLLMNGQLVWIIFLSPLMSEFFS